MLRSLFTRSLILIVAILSLVSVRASSLEDLTSQLKPREILQIEQSVDKVISKYQSQLTQERIQIIITKIDNFKMVARLQPKGLYLLEYLKWSLSQLLEPITIKKTPELSIKVTTGIVNTGSTIATIIKTMSYEKGAKILLAGQESMPVAKFEIAALYEDILIKDFSISSTNMLDDRIDSIQVYNKDGKLIATGNPVANKIQFNNQDILIKQGSQQRYCTVTTRSVGYNQASINLSPFTLNFQIQRAEGITSTEQIQVNTNAQQSDSISIRPMLFSKVALSNSYNGNSLETTLINGNSRLAYLTMSVDTATNTTSSNRSLQIIGNQLVMTLGNNIAGSLNSITIKNLNGSTSIAGIINGNTVAFPLSQLPESDRILSSGSEIAFLIELNANLSPSVSESISLNLENSGFSFTTNEDNTIYTDMGLGNGFMTSVSKKE